MSDFNDSVLDEQMALSPIVAAMVTCESLPIHDGLEQLFNQAHHDTREAFAAGLSRNRLVLQGQLSSPVICTILTSLESLDDPDVVEIMYERVYESKNSLAAAPWGELTSDAHRSLLGECAILARRLEIVQEQSDSAYSDALPPHPLASELEEPTRFRSIPRQFGDSRSESENNPFCGALGLAGETPIFVQDRSDASVVFLELQMSSLQCTGFRIVWSPKLTSSYLGEALPDAKRRLASYDFRKPTIYVLFEREKGQVIGVHMTPHPHCHSEAELAVQTILAASIFNGVWWRDEHQEEVES